MTTGFCQRPKCRVFATKESNGESLCERHYELDKQAFQEKLKQEHDETERNKAFKPQPPKAASTSEGKTEEKSAKERFREARSVKIPISLQQETEQQTHLDN